MKHSQINQSIKYIAKLNRPDIWFFTGTIKSFEHLCFERCYDPKNSLFEFFVPQNNIIFFEKIMDFYLKKGIVLELKKN